MLSLVLASKLGASMPSYADAVLGGYVHLDVDLLLRLERAVVLRALMPSDANIVHIGSVLLNATILPRLVLAPKLSAVMPHNVDTVKWRPCASNSKEYSGAEVL